VAFGRGGGQWTAPAGAACVRVAAWCVKQPVAELGGPLTEDDMTPIELPDKTATKVSNNFHELPKISKEAISAKTVRVPS
jgi:hypothetical protein